jgi:hypothetical protein
MQRLQGLRVDPHEHGLVQGRCLHGLSHVMLRVQAAWWVHRYTGSLGKVFMPFSTDGRHLRHVAHSIRPKSLHLLLPCTGRKGASLPY